MIVRCVFIISVLIWVVVSVELQTMVYFLCCSLVVLYLQGMPWMAFIKIFRLLLWLFVPILLFHGLFTPGLYVQSPIALPLTIEGLSRGLYLSLHIALIFFAAMLLYRSLTMAEWYSCLNRLPKANVLQPYFLLIPQLRKRLYAILSEQKQSWRVLEQRWLHLPDMLVLSIQDMLHAGEEEAEALWYNWDTRLASMHAEPIVLWAVKDIGYAVLLLLGWGFLWMN